MINSRRRRPIEAPNPPLLYAVLTAFSYIVITMFSTLQLILCKLGLLYGNTYTQDPLLAKDFPPLYPGLSLLFRLFMFRRFKEFLDTPIQSAPAAETSVEDRYTSDYGWTYQRGKAKKMINFGSYNYLGFAGSLKSSLDACTQAIRNYGISFCSSRNEIGNAKLHTELEATVARFVGVEDCICFGMGFATNSLNLPVLLSKNSLVISDELNHASIVSGVRLANCTIRVFRHNDMAHLESLLREAVLYRKQKKSEQSWDKIVIIVEGIYSMEGSIVDIKEVVRLKKKYKAYLYIDEAHSIGAMGEKGNGIVHYARCDPKDVDLMMGTFSKSFGAAGGYVGGRKKLIDYLRTQGHAGAYACSISPVIAQQVITTMKIIMGEICGSLGKTKLQQLKENTAYFRRRLTEMGFILSGDPDSPVVPLMVFLLGKLQPFHQECKRRGLATISVGYPCVPLLKCRVRFCLSAAHTREMLDRALADISDIGDLLQLKYNAKTTTAISLLKCDKIKQKAKEQVMLLSLSEHPSSNTTTEMHIGL